MEYILSIINELTQELILEGIAACSAHSVIVHPEP